MGKKGLLNISVIVSKATGLDVNWLLEQDVDTINYLGKEAQKILEQENEYKKLLIQATIKKMF